MKLVTSATSVIVPPGSRQNQIEFSVLEKQILFLLFLDLSQYIGFGFGQGRAHFVICHGVMAMAMPCNGNGNGHNSVG